MKIHLASKIQYNSAAAENKYLCIVKINFLTWFVSFLICAGFIFQIFSKTFILVIYEINKDYIAKNLCVNRNKPKMHCNGKCHLMKQLKKEEKKEEVPNIKDKNEQVQISEKKNFSFLGQNIPDDFSQYYFISNYSKPCFSIFHPPKRFYF
jgi:hypothetical protein